MKFMRCTHCGHMTLPMGHVSDFNRHPTTGNPVRINACFARYDGHCWSYGCAYDAISLEIKQFVKEMVNASECRYALYL